MSLSHACAAGGRRVMRIDSRVIKKTGSFAQTNLPHPATGNTFNAANEMTAFNGAALTYDPNGNLTNDGTNTYSWDARNHMTAISGGSTAGFVYDGLGRRAQKTISGTATQFLYDGLNPVQEIQNNAPSANLLTGLGIDEYFQRTDSAGARDYLTDILGSTLALTDSSGTKQTSYLYSPFGKTSASGQASSNAYQFTGRENDGTGLDYDRARYYSPATQRFIAQDPLEFGGGDADLYSYASNEPTGLTDPTGTQAAIGIEVAECLADPECVESITNAGLAALTALGLAISKSCTIGPGNNPDCTKATPFHLLNAGITNPHQFKTDWGAEPNSRFDICACKRRLDHNKADRNMRSARSWNPNR